MLTGWIVSDTPPEQTSLKELALLFLRLGATSFGGPAAHIAMMEDEIVGRRKWLNREQYLDMLALTNFIPGPNSTEMAIHIGRERAGLRGLLVAGVCFITPAVFMVLAIAWAYVRFGGLPISGAVLYGIKPVVIAIVVQALWRLGQTAVKSRFLAAVGVCAAIANALGVGELVVLGIAALFVGAVETMVEGGDRKVQQSTVPGLMPIGFLPKSILFGAAAATATVQLGKLFLVFLKVGSVLFGSGYVLLAFLRSDLVVKLGWLTDAQLLDATAVGQITPGPVFTTATFIGYILSGPMGALVATIGIFLPAFFFVAITAPLLPFLRRSKLASRVLDGLNVSSLALMGVVSVALARGAIVDLMSSSLALVSAILLIRFKINSSWLVLAGGIIGVLWTALAGPNS